MPRTQHPDEYMMAAHSIGQALKNMQDLNNPIQHQHP